MAIGTGVGGGSFPVVNDGGKGEVAVRLGTSLLTLTVRCAPAVNGCLEALAAAPAIARLATERATAAGEGPLWSKINSGKVLEAKDVFEAAKAGIPRLSVVDTIGLYLSVGLIAIRRVLAPIGDYRWRCSWSGTAALRRLGQGNGVPGLAQQTSSETIGSESARHRRCCRGGQEQHAGC